MQNKYRKHQNFEKKVILEAQKLYPGIRLWEAPTGQCYALYSVMNAIKIAIQTRSLVAAKKALIRVIYGKKGQAELTGIYKGTRIEVEIKTGSARQSEDQKNFQAMIERNQGIYLVVSDQKDIREQLNGLNKLNRAVHK